MGFCTFGFTPLVRGVIIWRGWLNWSGPVIFHLETCEFFFEGTKTLGVGGT